MDKKKIIIIVIAVVVVVAVAIAAIFLTRPKEEKEVPIVYSEYVIESQLANIQTPENAVRKSVVKYTISIKYVSDPETDELIKSKDSELKNEVRKYFMSKNATQLQRLERIQEDLVDVVIKTVDIDADKITNVFLVDFIIQ